MALIAQFTTIKPELAHSRTYQDFSKFLGDKPKRLGLVDTMYPEYTASFLTEGLGNIFYNKKKSGNSFQPIHSLRFEWEIQVNFIKRIKFANDVTDTGANGSDITMAFTERYYEKNDTFIIEGSKQQCMVMTAPLRKSDNYWEYTVRLIDNTLRETLDTDACKRGMETRFLTNYQPEYHEMGYTKFQSNVEKHRNWIGEHRVDIDQSSRYAVFEDTFVKISKGEGTGEYKEAIFKFPKLHEVLLNSFMEARNNALLWGKSTMDENGKSTIIDTEGRPIIAGDGVIPQINRFASFYNYSKLSVAVFNKAITTMTQKSKTPTGNTYVFVVNEVLYADAQVVLAEFLNQYKILTPALYSQRDGKKIEVGAEYVGYNFMGNSIIFKVDRALSYEYPDKGYGILLDLTADNTSGKSAISMFTIEGAEFITNTIAGVGGLDGKTSGVVASPVAGSKFVNSGYAGVGVFTPYRSFVLLQN